ncbi:hypothetical protein Tco_1177747 [Tanacetum coccineum]
MTNKIDWTNPEGERFHNDLSKPLPLVGPPGKKTIPTRYFFNNDLEYLRHRNEKKKYALLIISVQRITVEKKNGYMYLKEIVVKRANQKEYTFAEADFPRLNQNDIEYLYLLKIQDKIYNIDGVDEFDLITALKLYIRRIMIKKMSPSESVFSDGTLNKIREKLDVMLRDNKLGFGNEGMTDRKWTSKDKERTKLILEKIEKTLKERQIMRRLECFVGGRRNETDYRLLVRPE